MRTSNGLGGRLIGTRDVPVTVSRSPEPGFMFRCRPRLWVSRRVHPQRPGLGWTRPHSSDPARPL